MGKNVGIVIVSHSPDVAKGAADMYNAASRQLAKRGLKARRSIVGNYVTSLDMAGCSITVTVLNDELTALWDAPVHTAVFRWRI